jgi:hypothetical protein
MMTLGCTPMQCQMHSDHRVRCLERLLRRRDAATPRPVGAAEPVRSPGGRRGPGASAPTAAQRTDSAVDVPPRLLHCPARPSGEGPGRLPSELPRGPAGQRDVAVKARHWPTDCSAANFSGKFSLNAAAST